MSGTNKKPSSVEPFAFTGEGYEQARAWLKATGNWEKLERELSTDGYTAVALANKLRAESEGQE